MNLALDRDQLIERKLCEHQFAFLAVGMCQAVLAIPSKLGNRFLDRDDIREVVEYVRRSCHDALEHIVDLPVKVTQKDWQAFLEAEEEKEKVAGSKPPTKRPVRSK